MKRSFGAALGLAFLGMAGAAGAGVEKCVMQIGATQNYTIAPEILLSYDEASKTMEIYDGLIANFNKETPIKVKLNSEKPNSRSFGWSLFMVNSHGQRTKMQYVASYFIDTKAIHVQARPIGYTNVYSAMGTCRAVKG